MTEVHPEGTYRRRRPGNVPGVGDGLRGRASKTHKPTRTTGATRVPRTPWSVPGQSSVFGGLESLSLIRTIDRSYTIDPSTCLS